MKTKHPELILLLAILLTALFAFYACRSTAESAIDRQLRLCHEAQAAGNHGSEECGQ